MDSTTRLDTDVQELSEFDNGRWNEDGRDVQSLPRADGGKEAWLFLTACFMLEALVWGFPFSFGVFQVYYSRHEPFASEAGGIAAIGTTATGVMYFGAPFVAVAAQRWPKARRPSMALGVAVMVLALIAASFCNSVATLIATEGVLYALGGVVAYFPSMQYIDEWFVTKKGFAYGIMWAGTGSAGVVVPFLLQWLLDAYGFRTALRVWAVVLALLMTPALFFVKGRLPLTASNAFRPNDLSYLKRAPFWLFETGTIAQGLGFFLPTLWLPSFALSLGLPSFVGPLGLALYNIAFCVGAVFLGSLVDRFHVSTAILVSTIGQMVAIFIFWGLTTGQPMLYGNAFLNPRPVFAMIWGVFGGGFSATWSGCVTAMKQEGSGSNINTATVIALLAAGKGIGAVISGPLSEHLLEAGRTWHASFAYGSGYGVLIVFSGVSATLGGTAWIGRLMRLI